MSPPRNKKAIAFIHVFLAVQLLLPLAYYTVRADRNDERFAWRMFSSVRMISCRAEFRTGPEATPQRSLYGVFHEAWIELSKRGRMEVIDAMARALCAREGGDNPEVQVRVTCKTVDGETHERGGSWNVCRLGSR